MFWPDFAWVFKAGGGISGPVRDILGDALWAMMMFWIVSGVAPDCITTAAAGF